SVDARDDRLERFRADEDLLVLAEIQGVEFRGLLQRDAVDVACSAGGVGGKRRIDEEQAALGSDPLNDFVHRLGLGDLDLELFDDGELASGGAIEERTAERQRLHLAIDLLRIVARLRAEHDTATTPERGANGAGAGAAGTLLAPRFLTTTTDFTAGLGRMRAL